MNKNLSQNLKLLFAAALIFISMPVHAQESECEISVEPNAQTEVQSELSAEVAVASPILVSNVYLLGDESSKTAFRIFNPEEGINFLIEAAEYAKKNPVDMKRIELDRRYDIYIERIDETSHLTMIAGLRSLEEIEEERRIAAEKRAWEEANRFDPKDFHFVSDNFLPAMYSAVDLSSAMERSSTKDFSRAFYISDVTAVAQYGKAIYVKSQDKSSSKVMTINGRGNIRENEHVIIYYSLSKGDEDYVEWEISAIKILSES